MDLENILKKVDWLDDERRKDKGIIVTLEEKLKGMEENLQSSRQQVKELSSEINRLKALLPRMDQLDESFLKVKQDTKGMLNEHEKATRRREDEAEKLRRVEMKTIDTDMKTFKKEVDSVIEMRRNLQVRTDEAIRMTRLVEELKTQVEGLLRADEEFDRLYRMFEDNRRQDSKRITDSQGEIASLRKVVEELRGQYELETTQLKKLEARLGEVEAAEHERRQNQVKFFEEQALIQVERERIFKDWKARFDHFVSQSDELQTTLETLEETTRAVNRTQVAVEEVSQKVERRANELTELQRLGEERFRQEWLTFKNDDQKRWTNYSLIQDEQRDEINRTVEKLNERLIETEDRSVDTADLLQVINDQNEKQLRTLLATLHEWVSYYEKMVSQTK